MRPNNHAFNHKLFHIFNYAEITKYYKLVGPDLSFSLALLLNHIHRSLSFNFSFSPWVYLLSNVCKLIYKMLLLIIGNLKIASVWADWLTIKYCNNYLPNNLASEINSSWYAFPTHGLFLLVRLTDKIFKCTDSDRVG